MKKVVRCSSYDNFKVFRVEIDRILQNRRKLDPENTSPLCEQKNLKKTAFLPAQESVKQGGRILLFRADTGDFRPLCAVHAYTRPKLLLLALHILLSAPGKPGKTLSAGALQGIAVACIAENIIACPGFPLFIPLP